MCEILNSFLAIEKMFSAIASSFNMLWNVFKYIRINDVIDIAILSFLIFHGIKLIRETHIAISQGYFWF